MMRVDEWDEGGWGEYMALNKCVSWIVYVLLTLLTASVSKRWIRCGFVV